MREVEKDMKKINYRKYLVIGIIILFIGASSLPSLSNEIVVQSENQTYNHDVGVFSINSPIYNGPAQTFPVEVTITNYGIYPECCFMTKIQIGEIVGSTWIIEYEDEIALPSYIDPGQFIDFTFPDWTPDFLAEGITGTKDYKIEACTHLEDPPDQDPTNDCKSVIITLDFWHDVAVDVITSPDTCISTGTQSIEAVVINLGTFPELGLTASAEIKKGGVTVWGPAYIYGIDLNVPLGGTKYLNFGTFDFPVQGIYELTVCIPLAVDDLPANNCLTKKICVDDVTAPTTTHIFNPAAPTGNNGWYKGPPSTPVTVTLDATDDCEVAKTHYTLDGGLTWTDYTGPWPFSFPVSGCVKPGDFQYYSEDVCGNIESVVPTNFKVDTILPVKIPIDISIVHILLARDTCSGLYSVEWTKNGIPWPPWPPSQQFYTPPGTNQWRIKVRFGSGTVTTKVYDMAGNWA